MRVVLASVAAPGEPTSILLLPLVTFNPALKPTAMLGLTAGVVIQRTTSCNGVAEAGGVPEERGKSAEAILVAGRVVEEGGLPTGGVLVAGGVEAKEIPLAVL
jgi:hypothetical protein